MANTAKGASMKTSATAPKQVKFLSRYTSLPIALDVLVQKRITLLSPETWKDRNDAYFLERYREEMKLQSVLAICFSRHRETFHHWRVFSSGHPEFALSSTTAFCSRFRTSKTIDTGMWSIIGSRTSG